MRIPLVSTFFGLFRQRLQRFFSNRAPRADKAFLNLKNVYIFFSPMGRFFILLLVILFIAGVNYANNLILGLFFYLSSIWLISVYMTFSQVSGVQVRLLEVGMAEVGKPVWVTIQLVNESSRKRQLQLRFDAFDSLIDENFVSVDFGSKDRKVLKSRLQFKAEQQKKWAVFFKENKVRCVLDKTQTFRMLVPTNKRGRLILPRLVVYSDFPLGIMRAWSYVYFAKVAWVYPKPEVFDWQERNAPQAVGGEQVSLAIKQGQDDFDRLDEYVEGESLARVSWSHMARGQGLLSKHFADPVGYEMLLDYADMPAGHHEQKLAQLVYAVQSLGKQEVVFQLNLPNAVGEMGQGDEFVKASLLRLAKTP